MFNIEAGERRSNVEQYLGRTHDLELKKEEEIRGGTRCFYGYSRDKVGFFEIVYAGDIVIDSKMHEEILEVLAEEKFTSHLRQVAQINRAKEDVEFNLGMLFLEPIGSVIKSSNGYIQKYGEKENGKVYVKIHIHYDNNDVVTGSDLVEEVLEIDE